MNDMKRDIKVLIIDLYGCCGIERTKNKVSKISLHFTPLLVGEKQDANSNNFSKVLLLLHKRIFLINVGFQ
jgi:hypothetical protein